MSDGRQVPAVWWDRATNVVITDAPSWPAGSFTPEDAVQLVPAGELERLRDALSEAADRLDRLGDGSHMTEWSRSGEAGENRFRCEYAREAAAAARTALTAGHP